MCCMYIAKWASRGFLISVLWIIVCHFVLFLSAIILSVLLLFMASDYPFGKSKEF